MSSTLQYRGYEGTVQYSAEDKMLHGRLVCAGDVVIYGGDDLADLKVNFRGAVDEYLAFCEESGREPDAPIPAVEEITLRRDIQAKALQLAAARSQELSTVINKAVSEYLEMAS